MYPGYYTYTPNRLRKAERNYLKQGKTFDSVNPAEFWDKPDDREGFNSVFGFYP